MSDVGVENQSLIDEEAPGAAQDHGSGRSKKSKKKKDKKGDKNEKQKGIRHHFRQLRRQASSASTSMHRKPVVEHPWFHHPPIHGHDMPPTMAHGYTCVGVILAIGGITANCMELIDGCPQNENKHWGHRWEKEYKFYTVRIFNIIFLVMLATGELGLKLAVAKFGFVENMVARGLLYLYVGSMTLSTDEEKSYYNFTYYLFWCYVGYAGLCALATIYLFVD